MGRLRGRSATRTRQRLARAAAHGFVVLDVETTGLSPARDRVVEIALVRTDGTGRVEDEWATRVHPQGPVGATAVHGIRGADVRNAPAFPELVDALGQRLDGRTVVAHNARFDLAFLRHEWRRAGVRPPSLPVLCTLETSRALLPRLRHRRLADCCRAVGVGNERPHSALGDARATAALLAWFLAPSVGPTGPRTSRDRRRRRAAASGRAPARAPAAQPIAAATSAVGDDAAG